MTKGIIHERIIAERLESADLTQDGRGVDIGLTRDGPDRQPFFSMGQIVSGGIGYPGRENRAL